MDNVKPRLANSRSRVIKRIHCILLFKLIKTVFKKIGFTETPLMPILLKINISN